MLERVRLNVAVDTDDARSWSTTTWRGRRSTPNLRVLGTPYETGLSGRLDGRRRRRDDAQRAPLRGRARRRRGSSTSGGSLPSRRPGDEHLGAATTRSPLGNRRAGRDRDDVDLDPTLPEPDIMALLVTGRTLDEMRGEEFEVAQEQVLSYLDRAGRLAARARSRAGDGAQRGARRAHLIANETDPSARLTRRPGTHRGAEPDLLRRSRRRQRGDVGSPNTT